MRPITKSASYLIRNKYSYCFRMNVPADLQEIIGKRELRYSLKTGYLGDAKYKARIIASGVQRIFRYIRKGNGKLSELTKKQIDEMVRRYMKEGIEKIDNEYLEPDYHPISNLNELDDHLYDTYLQGEFARFCLASGNYDQWEDDVADILRKNEIQDIEKGSPSYIRLCRGILRAEMKLADMKMQDLKGDNSEILDSILKSSGAVQASSNETNSGELISEVIDKFISEKSKTWTEKTKDEHLSKYKLFLEFFGDVPIQSINRKKIGEYKQTLMKLPLGRNKNPDYRDKTIDEILQMEISKKMSSTTVGKYLTRVGALFEYARLNGIYVGENPAIGMNPPDKRMENEARAPFDDLELTKLFHSQEYLEDKHNEPFKFWMPILALFTGARQNELAQLHLSDIKKTDDEVWFFDINDENEKNLKSKNSRRKIPIHNFLLEELNILSYVDQLKSNGEKRLFPELKRERDGYGRKVSRWFNEKYKIRCGIESNDNRKRDFHSFRATFITYLTHKGVNERMRLQVEGHSGGRKDMTSVYADPFPVKQIYDEVISRLDYGIDLTHLRNSKYVVKD